MLSRTAGPPAVTTRLRQDAVSFGLRPQPFPFQRRKASINTTKLSNAYISRLEEGGNVKVNQSTLKRPRYKQQYKQRQRAITINYAVKDNFASLGLPTTCASALLQGYQSPIYATLISDAFTSKFETVVGKTNLDEFGMGSHSLNSFFGSVRQVRDGVGYSAGGSSGGSAMSLVDSQEEEDCAFALGTDTGGSVRLPAAYTGVVGFKPSYGMLSRFGVVPYANSLDTVGIMAKNLYTIVDTFGAKGSYFDKKDPTSLPYATRERLRGPNSRAKNLRRLERYRMDLPSRTKATIGVPIEYNIAEMSLEVRNAWQKTLDLLQANGCIIMPVSLPNTKHALSAYYVIAPAEAASNLAKYDGVRYGKRAQNGDAGNGPGNVLYSSTRAGFGDEVKRRILLGSYTLSSEAIDNYFIKAQKVRRLVQRDFDRVFKKPNPLRDPEHFDLSDMDETIELEDKLGPPQVDFIVCPTAPTTAPTLEEVRRQTPLDSYVNDVFTVPASLAGLPAISIPYKLRQHDYIKPLPIGIQIIGQHSDDMGVLGLAHELYTLLDTITKESETEMFAQKNRW
jgi:aspartyl-tRNA(Asn)/glutamyl-tRNA(Gln) amidotransferase subunit A